jgi:hypothetical protein
MNLQQYLIYTPIVVVCYSDQARCQHINLLSAIAFEGLFAAKFQCFTNSYCFSTAVQQRYS